MIEISKFVVVLNSGEYLHTVLQKILPKNSSKYILKKNLFLESQNKKAIEKRIFEMKDFLSIWIIPTWSCNMRCPFCFVLHQLKKSNTDQSLAKIDCGNLITFTNNYFKSYNPKKIGVSFIGGEPLLNIDNCENCNNVFLKISNQFNVPYTNIITTNLSINIGHKEANFLSKMSQINVSIDGDEQSHNSQRKYVNSSDNSYRKTLKNLKILVGAGLSNKISINATLNDEIINDHQRLYEFNLTLQSIGILENMIKFAPISSTKNFNNTKEQFNYINDAPITTPCCAFRYMNSFIVDSNGVYSNYFDITNSKLGNLCSPMKDVARSYKNIILNTMPCLKDENCLDCEVLGLCWGACCGNKLMKDNPSKYCNKKSLCNIKNDAIKKNTLKNMIMKNEAEYHK